MSHFNHFNIIGPIYDLIFGRRIDQEIVNFAEMEAGQYLLDVGGGTGRVSILFKDITQNVLIADSALNMVQEAQAKGLRPILSHSENLPFVDQSFDRIIMVDALHHVADQKRTLEEMWRLLSPDGKMIIEEPDIANFVVKLIALGEKILLMRSHFLEPSAIIKMGQFDQKAQVEIYRESGNAWIIISKNKQDDKEE